MDGHRSVISGILSVVILATTKAIETASAVEEYTKDPQYTIQAVGVALAAIAALYSIINGTPAVYRKLKAFRQWLTLSHCRAAGHLLILVLLVMIAILSAIKLGWAHDWVAGITCISAVFLFVWFLIHLNKD